MIEKPYIEYINYEIDGVITPHQKALLDDYLKVNPEAEKLYMEMIATSKILNATPQIEPSTNLKKRILNSVIVKPFEVRSKTAWISNLNLDWIFNPKSKLAFAFILGMFVTFLLLTPFWLHRVPDKTVRVEDFYGTMALTHIKEIKPYKQMDLDLSFIQGQISFKRHEQLYILELNIACDDQTELAFEFNPDHLQLLNIKPGLSNQKMEINNSLVKIADTEIINSLLFFTSMSHVSTTIDLKVYRNGILQLHQNIELNSASVTK